MVTRELPATEGKRKKKNTGPASNEALSWTGLCQREVIARIKKMFSYCPGGKRTDINTACG